jgi:hypothetical protein
VKDLVKSLYECSEALFDARMTALTANRHDIVDQLREAQRHINLALSISVPDQTEKAVTP